MIKYCQKTDHSIAIYSIFCIKKSFPDTRGAGYLWLSQCTMAPTASWKCVFRTPCGAKALKKNKKRKEPRCKKRTILCRMFCRRNVYIAWIGAHPTDSTAMRHFFLHTWVMLIDSLYSSLQFSTSRVFHFYFQGLRCSSFFSRFEFSSAIPDCLLAFYWILLMSICF